MVPNSPQKKKAHLALVHFRAWLINNPVRQNDSFFWNAAKSIDRNIVSEMKTLQGQIRFKDQVRPTFGYSLTTLQDVNLLCIGLVQTAVKSERKLGFLFFCTPVKHGESEVKNSTNSPHNDLLAATQKLNTCTYLYTRKTIVGGAPTVA